MQKHCTSPLAYPSRPGPKRSSFANKDPHSLVISSSFPWYAQGQEPKPTCPPKAWNPKSIVFPPRAWVSRLQISFQVFGETKLKYVVAKSWAQSLTPDFPS